MNSSPRASRRILRLILASACLLLALGAQATPSGQLPTHSVYAAASSPPVIISPDSATSVVNQSFNYQIILANFQTGTYAAQGLADGLTLDPASGVISGSPTRIGTFTAALTATNANGTGSATLTLTVLPAAPPVISGPTEVTTVNGTAFTYQIVADGSPASYGADGLPAGLLLNPETGLISGVPTDNALSQVTLSATNARGTGTSLLKLSVVPSLPTVTLTADVPAAYPLRGEGGRFTLVREGGDLTQPLLVVVSIKGSARNGVDYPTLSFAQIIKANKKSRRVKVDAFPLPDDTSSGKKTVKLSLAPSDAYGIGSAATAKVKIFYTP